MRRILAGAAVALSLVALTAGPAHADNEFSVSATLLDFGDVNVGSSAQIIVTVTRVAPGSGEVNGYGGGPADGVNFGAAQNCQNAILAQGQSCQFYYTFQPQVGGFLQTTTSLTLEALDTGGSSFFAFTLQGNGVGGPDPTVEETLPTDTLPSDTGPSDTGPTDTKGSDECRDPAQPVETDEKGNALDQLPLCPDQGPLPCTTNPPPPATDAKGNPVDTKLPPCPEDLGSATGTTTGTLPRTGTGSGEVFVIAGLLMLLGGTVVAVTRRAATR